MYLFLSHISDVWGKNDAQFLSKDFFDMPNFWLTKAANKITIKKSTSSDIDCFIISYDQGKFKKISAELFKPDYIDAVIGFFPDEYQEAVRSAIIAYGDENE